MAKPKAKRTSRTVVNLYDAKTQLSELVERAASGEEITIAKAGTPRARLVPLPRTPRRPGALKGKIWVSRDFDEPLPADIQRAFLGYADAEDGESGGT